MSVVAEFQFHQLIATPRVHDPGGEDQARIAAQLFAAVTASHAEMLNPTNGSRGAIAVAWDRPPGTRAVRVLVGGRPHFPPAQSSDGSVVPILYPPGTVGRPVDTAGLTLAWERIPVWLRCLGRSDPLWVRTTEPAIVPARGGFEDYVVHLPGPFVWLVIAEPVDADDVRHELSRLETQLPRLRQRVNSEPDRVALRRAEFRYRELSRALPSGVWRVHLLVGGTDETAARRAAGLLCSASDLDGLPYALAPAAKCAALHETWQDTATDDRDAFASPFRATGEFLAAVARPPRRELAGVRSVERPEFDVTPEHSGEIHLGAVLDEADAVVGEFGAGLDTLNRHTFVAGATGSGKSQTVRHLLEGLHDAGVPWLVIEPAKAEYAGMAGRLAGRGEVLAVRPGDPEAPPVCLNPLAPAPGFPLQTHIDLTRALFLAAFRADEPFPQVLSHALARCYAELGWDTVTGDATTIAVPRYPTLGDLRRTALHVVDTIGYGKEITQNVRGFIDVRLSSLRLGTPGRFFEGGHPVDFADLLRRNVVLEIEDIGADTDKAFFIGAILVRLFEHLRTRHDAARATGLRHVIVLEIEDIGADTDKAFFIGAILVRLFEHLRTRHDAVRTTGLRHVIVLEEAHRLLRHAEPGTPTALAVELFTGLLAEIRAYGEGVTIVEQIPSKIVTDVLKNTALKIMHRLPAADDRATVGATMNLDDQQSRHVVTLPPGRAVVFADGMDHPVRVSVPLGQQAESAADTVRVPPVVTRRSVACGHLCHDRPCRLREIGVAARHAEDSRLVLWIELVAVAHLVGRPAPVPDPGWLRRLRDRLDERVLECAVAHRVQTAIDSRYTGLAAHYSPEALGAHLAAGAHAALRGLPSPCEKNEPRWQAGPYRWIDVLHALRTSDFPPDAPHPDTAAWAERDLDLPNTNIADQLDALRRHPDSWSPSQRVITGGEPPTAIERAMAQLSNHTRTTDRFREATSFLDLNHTWATTVLELTDTDEVNR